MLIFTAPALTVSAQDTQHAVGPSGSADPGRHSAPDAASGPGITICDPGTFANCHKVQGVVPPKLTHTVDPEFTPEAIRRGLDGLTIIGAVLDEQGHLQDQRVVHSFSEGLPPQLGEVGKGMDENAEKAVRKYRFKPATLNGKPVSVKVTIQVRFHHSR